MLELSFAGLQAALVLVSTSLLLSLQQSFRCRAETRTGVSGCGNLTTS